MKQFEVRFTTITGNSAITFVSAKNRAIVYIKFAAENLGHFTKISSVKVVKD